MDRLNKAATSKVVNVLSLYSDLLADDIANTYAVPIDELKPYCQNIFNKFIENSEEVTRHAACAWFTKRGEPCHKERRPGSDFCSVHAEYFQLHTEEVAKAKVSPDKINVTRKDIHKT